MKKTDRFARPGAGQGLRVLIVDDDPAITESTAVFLQMQGHQARSAASGGEALGLIEGFLPQVVLLDIGLPGENGCEVARRLRALPEAAGAVLVAMSGYSREMLQGHADEDVFDRYLIKPVVPDTLVGLLAEIAEARRPAG